MDAPPIASPHYIPIRHPRRRGADRLPYRTGAPQPDIRRWTLPNLSRASNLTFRALLMDKPTPAQRAHGGGEGGDVDGADGEQLLGRDQRHRRGPQNRGGYR